MTNHSYKSSGVKKSGMDSLLEDIRTIEATANAGILEMHNKFEDTRAWLTEALRKALVIIDKQESEYLVEDTVAGCSIPDEDGPVDRPRSSSKYEQGRPRRAASQLAQTNIAKQATQTLRQKLRQPSIECEDRPRTSRSVREARALSATNPDQPNSEIPEPGNAPDLSIEIIDKPDVAQLISDDDFIMPPPKAIPILKTGTKRRRVRSSKLAVSRISRVVKKEFLEPIGTRCTRSKQRELQKAAQSHQSESESTGSETSVSSQAGHSHDIKDIDIDPVRPKRRGRLRKGTRKSSGKIITTTSTEEADNISLKLEVIVDENADPNIGVTEKNKSKQWKEPTQIPNETEASVYEDALSKYPDDLPEQNSTEITRNTNTIDTVVVVTGVTSPEYTRMSTAFVKLEKISLDVGNGNTALAESISLTGSAVVCNNSQIIISNTSKESAVTAAYNVKPITGKKVNKPSIANPSAPSSTVPNSDEATTSACDGSALISASRIDESKTVSKAHLSKNDKTFVLCTYADSPAVNICQSAPAIKTVESYELSQCPTGSKVQTCNINETITLVSSELPKVTNNKGAIYKNNETITLVSSELPKVTNNKGATYKNNETITLVSSELPKVTNNKGATYKNNETITLVSSELPKVTNNKGATYKNNETVTLKSSKLNPTINIQPLEVLNNDTAASSDQFLDAQEQIDMESPPLDGSYITDDESAPEDSPKSTETEEKYVPPVAIKKGEALFHDSSPVKSRVRAFEKAMTPIAPRMTRTKAKALKNAQSIATSEIKENTAPVQKPPSAIKPPSAKYQTPTTGRKPLKSAFTPGSNLTNIVTGISSFLPKPANQVFKPVPPVNRDEERLKQMEKADEAMKKREALLQARRDDQRRKREEKIKLVQQSRELKERERLLFEKQTLEKDEKHRQMLAEREEKQREEIKQKKILAAQKASESMERRRIEEQARLAKLKEQEEELKRIEAQRRQEQEDAERLRLIRQAEQAAEAEQLRLKKARAEQQARQLKLQQLKLQQAIPGPAPVFQMQPPCMQNGFEYLGSDNSTDDEDKPTDKPRNRPEWSKPHTRKIAIASQSAMPSVIIDKCFSVQATTPNLAEIFPTIDPKLLRRKSSALWRTPPRYSMMQKY